MTRLEKLLGGLLLLALLLSGTYMMGQREATEARDTYWKGQIATLNEAHAQDKLRAVAEAKRETEAAQRHADDAARKLATTEENLKNEKRRLAELRAKLPTVVRPDPAPGAGSAAPALLRGDAVRLFNLTVDAANISGAGSGEGAGGVPQGGTAAEEPAVSVDTLYDTCLANIEIAADMAARLAAWNDWAAGLPKSAGGDR